MKLAEKFLRSHLYLILIMVVSFTIWSSRYFMELEKVTSFSFNIFFLLTIPLFLLLITFKNTIYTVPIILVALFTLGIPSMDISTLDVAFVGILNIILVIIGFLIHFIRFKPAFKLKSLGLSLALASISFMIPLIYTPFSSLSLLLVCLVPFYLIVYLFYANTIKTNEVNYLMRTFIYISLMLSLQLISLMSEGFTDFRFLHDINEFKTLFVDSPLWGNVNDLTIQLVLMASSVFYLLKKYKHIFPWLYLGWIGFWIIISDSRGSIVTISLFALGVVIYTLIKGKKHQKINLALTVLILGLFLFVFKDLVKMVFDSFFGTIDFDNPDGMLTGRITLWFDKNFGAVTVFKTYPIFGSGWNTPHWFLYDQNRITIYHSTFFQVLATGGVVGILILIYHFYELSKIFIKNHSTIVNGFLFAYLLTQLHGLMDNTQYMIHYSIVTFITFAVIENKNNNVMEVGLLDHVK